MNLFGFRCFHCEKPLQLGIFGFCSNCRKLVGQQSYCHKCGMNLTENRQSCGYCLRNDPKWHNMVRVAEYRPPMSDWIHHFKLQNRYWLDQALAIQLLLAIKQAQREQGLVLPEVILPVPLYWQRQWRRGFNQSELLSGWLAKWLQIPCDRQSLTRIRPTASQRELTAAARRRNLRQAFCYQPPKNYRRVAVVDDVVTTGSTLNAVCAELLKAGVAQIQVWTLARA